MRRWKEHVNRQRTVEFESDILVGGDAVDRDAARVDAFVLLLDVRDVQLLDRVFLLDIASTRHHQVTEVIANQHHLAIV